MDGHFKIDNGNFLNYHVKQPQDAGIPEQIKLSGNYSLDKNHNLVLTLNRWNNQPSGDELTIKGELLDASADEVSFAVTTKESDAKTSTYILKLNGSWQADRYNRLSFSASKTTGASDKLVLRGAWEVNKQNEIIYTYTRSSLKTKKRLTNALTFKGFWDITQKYRISYVLNKEINSRFDFKAAIGRPFKRGMKYSLGVGLAPSKKQITLFGEWKIDEDSKITFEMPYENERPRSFVVKASRKILNGRGEAFMQALRSWEGLTFTAGAGFIW